VGVHSASGQDSKHLGTALHEALAALPRLWKLYLDLGYRGMAVELAEEFGLHVVLPPPKTGGGFVPQSQRWVIERTIAWLSRLRRLTRDYERTPNASEAWVRIAGIFIALRKLANA
jgi:putative transposase